MDPRHRSSSVPEPTKDPKPEPRKPANQDQAPSDAPPKDPRDAKRREQFKKLHGIKDDSSF